jgi:hypothetical protein
MRGFIMKAFVCILLILALPVSALAVSTSQLKDNLASLEVTEAPDTLELVDVLVAFQRIILSEEDADTRAYLLKRITHNQQLKVAAAILKASKITDIDWRLLLSIAYIESHACLNVRGDQKPNTDGKQLYDFWAVGCCQIHTKWWGNILADSGLTQEDLLDPEINFIFAAMILDKYQTKYGYWEGIRRYNGVGAPSIIYLNKVKSLMKVISVGQDNT